MNDSRLPAAVVAAALLAFAVRSAVSGGAAPLQILLCFTAVALISFLLSFQFISTRRDRLVLATLAGLVAVARLQGFHEPLEADITGYAVTGHEILSGARFLVDIWGMRPPLTYLTFAGFESIAGFGDSAVYLLNVTFTVITLYAVYHAARAFDRLSDAGIAAAAMWVLISGHVYFQANQPNSEVMINALTTAALAILLGRGALAGPKALFAAGCLLALASQYKQIVLAPAVALAAVEAGERIVEKDYRRAAVALVCLLAPIGLFWMMTGAYFFATGRGGVFMETYFQNTLAYVEANRATTGTLSLMVRLFGDNTVFIHAAISATLIGSMMALASGRRKTVWKLFLAAIVSAQAAIMMPGRYYPHYFQLWLPLIAIGCSCLSFSLPSWNFRAPVFLACFTAAAWSIFPQSALSPAEVSRVKYGRRFIDHARIGAWLSSLVDDGGRIFVWSNASGLYYYSGRSPGAAVLWVNNLSAGPMRVRLEQMVFRQLADGRTHVIVFDRAAPAAVLSRLRQDGWVPIATVDTATMAADVLARNDGSVLRHLKEESVSLPLTFR